MFIFNLVVYLDLIAKFFIFNRTSVQYLPFYGGAKGQYLEQRKDSRGGIVSEKIVSEDSISSEHIIKNTDDSLLSKVFSSNLQKLKDLSESLLKLHNLGRKTGFLSNEDKIRFSDQLTNLGETSSNTIKLIEEIGDNVDILLKNENHNKQAYEDDVGEEGVGIDSSGTETQSELLSGSTIAEAKPIGLAIIGENGLAASRPVATAVAQTGIALARPIATAIAGVDPVALGIQFQINQTKKQ